MTNVGPLSLAQLSRRIREFPVIFSDLVKGMDEKTLALPIRENGWTIRQMIHHIADSHVNLYCRMRFILTEDDATVKPYDQNAWAELGDARDGDIRDSLQLVEAIHNRSAALLDSITPEQLDKKGHHPEVGQVTVEYFARALIFHGKHHLRKINEALSAAKKKKKKEKAGQVKNQEK